MKVFVTAYALTSGIVEVDAETTPFGRSVSYRTRDYRTAYVGPNDWFVKREDAVVRAEAMRVKAIEAAKIKIEQLSVMVFE